ncbi:DNA ligase [Candidatus Pacearchaeota archaeon]|nr:DNA ligase [Candidatus Pacearchaeota archaeon]|tara:strand:- start:20 stop:1732 length:1713 start_codon:yes stop_codon:yes gene_type:complete
MKYSLIVDVYEKLSGTTKKLEKTSILAKFLPKLKGNEEWSYLFRGKVFPDYNEKVFGISNQLVMKAISRASGISEKRVVSDFKKIGDLGDVAVNLVGKKRQKTLFAKSLTVEKVFENLKKLTDMEGKGSVDRKLALVVELLGGASGVEARYIIRTLLQDLRVGVADGIMRDSIAEAFLDDWKENREKVEGAYDRVNDWAFIIKLAKKGVKALNNVKVTPGRPMKVMLPVKVTDVSEAFRICGKPLAVEHKYDGFRVIINKDDKGRVSLFTRKLDNVTNQFPDVVEIVKKHVKGKSFVIDSEVVGYDPKTKKTKPFEFISQRIKRKHEIPRLVKKLPVEINVFDVMFYDGKSVIDLFLRERRKLIEKIVKTEKFKIRLSKQFISDDEKEVTKFYKDALKIGEEGIMFKKLDAPYRPGRRVGYMVKMKPDAKDLDLVITGAEYGTGKRAGGLTSFYVACSDEGASFLEVGRVSSGLKEKDDAGGTTYSEMDKLLQPLIIKENGTCVSVKPKIIVSVTYQNVQRSPKYASGFALRFPRITHYRPDYHLKDIATLKDFDKEVKKEKGWRKDILG